MIGPVRLGAGDIADRTVQGNRLLAGVALRAYRGFFFHGGAPGLKPGDRLLPPDVTGTGHALSGYTADAAAEPEKWRRDLVYCTANPWMAARFAATFPGGSVYMVDPRPPLAVDPYVPAESLAVRCTDAVVVAEVEAVVPLVSQPLIIAETLRARDAGEMGALHRRALDAMRVSGLLDGRAADEWEATPPEAPTMHDLARSVRAAAEGLEPAERERLTGRRVA